ncbi:QRFP-like peptide receptor [Nematostella vectensis]|uniref:QRFP-like peptide receptor n=1 Tax=Nematostella vectensis TaxID=45351 RepID=UPI002076EE9F|nr:QRFP-like peptide receptor [Nematostella vectensis]
MNSSLDQKNSSVSGTAMNGSLGVHGGTTTEDVFKLVACALVGVLSLVGNILVVVVVFKAPRLKTATFYLLVNMSVSDLLFTCISMPPFMVNITGRGLLVGGSAGLAACKIVNSSAFGLMASSVLTMTAIAFDRYIAIIKPMNHIMTGKLLKAIVLGIWIVSIAIMIPLIIVLTVDNYKDDFYCDENWKEIASNSVFASKVYTVMLFIIIYIIPFTTMTVLYSIIGQKLWFKKAVRNVNREQQRLVVCQRRRIVCMLVVVLVAFVCCWLPLQIVTFMAYFSDTHIPRPLYFTGEFLVRANGALNPLVYFTFSKTFKREVLSLKPFSYCFKRKQFTVTMMIGNSPGMRSLRFIDDDGRDKGVESKNGVTLSRNVPVMGK